MTIYRQETTRDDYGGVKSEWKKYLWDEPCRIYSIGGQVFTISYQGKDYSITRKLMCLRDVDIQEGDKVEEENSREVLIVVRVYPIQTFKRLHHLEGLLARIEE